MLLPDPDNQRSLQTAKDFLDSIQDKTQRNIYSSIISPLEPLRQRIKATWRAPDGLPDLLFVKNAKVEETELRDIVNTVCLAEGLLEHCMVLQGISARIMKARKIPPILGAHSVAKISLMWAFAHEVFHFIRRHALVEKHFGSDSPTKHALEYDADMCATAAIYRYIQFFSSRNTELLCKRRVLAHLYWILRMEVEKNAGSNFTGTETHQHAAARLQAIVGKLAMMHNSGPADPGLSTHTSQLHLSELTSEYIQLELAFLNKGGANTNNRTSTVADFTFKNSDMQFTFALHQRWDEISPLIDHFSLLKRSMINNETSIAFVGDIFSMPRL